MGLEEATKVLEGETLDEGRVETNGDGLLEFTDVVLNLPKGGYVAADPSSLGHCPLATRHGGILMWTSPSRRGWEETLHGFEYKDK